MSVLFLSIYNVLINHLIYIPCCFAGRTIRYIYSFKFFHFYYWLFINSVLYFNYSNYYCYRFLSMKGGFHWQLWNTVGNENPSKTTLQQRKSIQLPIPFIYMWRKNFRISVLALFTGILIFWRTSGKQQRYLPLMEATDLMEGSSHTIIFFAQSVDGCWIWT